MKGLCYIVIIYQSMFLCYIIRQASVLSNQSSRAVDTVVEEAATETTVLAPPEPSQVSVRMLICV